MSDEMKNEIYKSYVYGMRAKDLSEVYGISEAEVSELLEQNADKVEEVRKYRAMLEGE